VLFRSEGGTASPGAPGYAPSWLLWTGIATTALGAVAATIAGVAVLDAEADWNRARCVNGVPTCEDIRGRYEVAAPVSTAGFVLGGVGLGVLILELAFGVAGVTP
jgi:hypothetical protein